MYIVQDLHVIQNPSNNIVCSYSPSATKVQPAFAMLNKTLNPLSQFPLNKSICGIGWWLNLTFCKCQAVNSFVPFHQPDSKFIDHPVILLLLQHHKVCAWHVTFTLIPVVIDQQCITLIVTGQPILKPMQILEENWFAP